jgi:hypothetical protein
MCCLISLHTGAKHAIIRPPIILVPPDDLGGKRYIWRHIQYSTNKISTAKVIQVLTDNTIKGLIDDK